jgi:general secretion pathway protein G
MTKARRRNAESGFSLIELLIVVAIIGIIAVLAYPNLIAAIQRSRQSRTVADLRLIGEALELYQNDHSRYPAIDNGTVADLVDELRIYVRNFNHLDGWGNAMYYDSDGTFYTVLSLGWDSNSDTPYSFGTTHTFDADIVFANGSFYQWPEGPQEY